MFKTLLQYPALTWLLGVLWLMSGVCFVLLWLRERATEQDVQDRLSERALQEGFQYVCWHANLNPEKRFTRLDVIENQLDTHSPSPGWLRHHGQKVTVKQYLRGTLVALMLFPKLTQPAAEEIAAFYLAKWLERGVIKRSSYADAVDWLEVDAAVLERYQ